MPHLSTYVSLPPDFLHYAFGIGMCVLSSLEPLMWSFHALLHKAMAAAYERANADPEDPDPELDLGGAEAPHFTNHSWRRFADRVARASMLETGASEVDIDRFFGWLDAHYEKLMQLHYAGREDRVKRSRVTMKV